MKSHRKPRPLMAEYAHIVAHCYVDPFSKAREVSISANFSSTRQDRLRWLRNACAWVAADPQRRQT